MLRLEQLYPFPEGPLGEELERFPNAEIVCARKSRASGRLVFRPPANRISYGKAGAAGASAFTSDARIRLHGGRLMSQHNAELHYIMDEAMRFDLKIRTEDDQ